MLLYIYKHHMALYFFQYILNQAHLLAHLRPICPAAGRRSGAAAATYVDLGLPARKSGAGALHIIGWTSSWRAPAACRTWAQHGPWRRAQPLGRVGPSPGRAGGMNGPPF